MRLGDAYVSVRERVRSLGGDFSDLLRILESDRDAGDVGHRQIVDRMEPARPISPLIGDVRSWQSTPVPDLWTVAPGGRPRVDPAPEPPSEAWLQRALEAIRDEDAQRIAAMLEVTLKCVAAGQRAGAKTQLGGKA